MLDPLALAIDLIRRPSVTPHDEGALGVVEAVLQPLGFTCERLVFEGDGGDRTENLYARRGTVAPYLMFAGHTDVVPPGDVADWSIPPFDPQVVDGYLMGRGAEDMKGAIACMLAAVSRVQQGEGSIGFLITGDEEGYAINGTRKVVEWMRARGEKPDACIVGEPTNPDAIGDMVKIGRRGSMNMVLTVQGKQGHVAYPHLADNPCTPLLHILHALKTHTIDEGMDFFQPSNLEITSIDVGNPAKNVIPAKAEARINIRFNPLHDSAKMAAWVRETAARYAQNFTLDVRVTGEAFLTPPGAFSEMLSASVLAATGKAPVLSTTGGTSDARFIKDICQVAEFGTTGRTPHMVDEKVKVGDLYLLTDVYENILRAFLKAA